jgi:hypothetical protein
MRPRKQHTRARSHDHTARLVGLARWLSIASVGTLACACTSVWWLDASGDVRRVGLASVVPVVTDGGRVTRVVAPGMALRVLPGTLRWSAGWQETTVFVAQRPGEASSLVAIGDHTVGIALEPATLLIGAEHRFAVLEPGDERPVQRAIHYTTGRPQPTWLRTWEVE